MSKEVKSPQNNSEEVDLGQLFNAIGMVFDRFYNFIVFILQFIFSLFITCSRAIIKNFKILILAMTIAGVLGFLLEKVIGPKYESTMLVRTYFDSKYQLHANINYYNSLLIEENYDLLTDVFNQEEDAIKQIKSFEIEVGPESENEQMSKYNAYLETLDSVRAMNIEFDDYLENRSDLDGNLFLIRVESANKSIFKDLEGGINKAFVNSFSNKEKRKRDSTIVIKKNTILNSISELDSLQNVYVKVLQEESQALKGKVNLGDGFPMQQEKSSTNEYELLNRELDLRNELRDLEEEIVERNDFVDVLTTFQEVGNKVDSINTKFSITLPLLTFLILCFVYLINTFVRFVKNYEK